MSDISRFGLRHRTQIVHERLLTAVHEHVLWMSEQGDTCADEVVGSARQLVILGQQLKIMAVLKARVVYDAPWAVVAISLGMDEVTARKVYEDAEKRWLNGDPTPWVARAQDPAVRPLLRRVFGRDNNGLK